MLASERLRKLIYESRLTYVKISIATGIDESQICRFMKRQRDINLSTYEILLSFFEGNSTNSEQVKGLKTFFKINCIFGEYMIPRLELYAGYLIFCEEMNFRFLPRNQFGRNLRLYYPSIGIFHKRLREKRVRWHIGVKLKNDFRIKYLPKIKVLLKE